MFCEDDPAAVLTKAQRRYLLGEELDDAQERAIRARIRKRIQMGLLDLSLIINSLPKEDIDKALTEPEEYEAELGSAPPLMNSLPALAAILYLATTPEENEEDLLFFTESVGEGVKTAVNLRGKTAEELDGEWHLKVGDPLEERAQGDLSELPEHVLKQLLVAEEITSDQYAEAWTAKQADDEE